MDGPAAEFAKLRVFVENDEQLDKFIEVRGRCPQITRTIAKVFVYLAIAAALALYVRHSERVRNTFVR